MITARDHGTWSWYVITGSHGRGHGAGRGRGALRQMVTARRGAESRGAAACGHGASRQMVTAVSVAGCASAPAAGKRHGGHNGGRGARGGEGRGLGGRGGGGGGEGDGGGAPVARAVGEGRGVCGGGVGRALGDGAEADERDAPAADAEAEGAVGVAGGRGAAAARRREARVARDGGGLVVEDGAGGRDGAVHGRGVGAAGDGRAADAGRIVARGGRRGGIGSAGGLVGAIVGARIAGVAGVALDGDGLADAQRGLRRDLAVWDCGVGRAAGHALVDDDADDAERQERGQAKRRHVARAVRLAHSAESSMNSLGVQKRFKGRCAEQNSEGGGLQICICLH